MVWKIIFFSLSLMIAYEALMRLEPDIDYSSNEWQENENRAQRFLFSDSVAQDVIVGTSLAARMPMDSLPGFATLCFSGGSPVDGLAIIEKGSALPRRIYIETNILTHRLDSDFVDRMTNPWYLGFTKIFHSFRAGKSPASIASSGLISFGKKTSAMLQRLLGHQAGNPKAAPAKDPGFELILRQLVQDIVLPDKAFTAEALSPMLTNLSKHVALLRQKGVEIIFFEMPVNSAVCDLPGPRLLRTELIRLFPPDQFRTVGQPDCSSYTTTDGLHLTAPDASKYAAYFKAQIRK